MHRIVVADGGCWLQPFPPPPSSLGPRPESVIEPPSSGRLSCSGRGPPPHGVTQEEEPAAPAAGKGEDEEAIAAGGALWSSELQPTTIVDGVERRRDHG